MKKNLMIYILALVAFLVGTNEYMITGVIGMMAADLGVTTTQVGFLVTIFALAGAILTPILVALTINIDRKKVLLASLVIFIASNGLMYAKLTYEALLWIRLIQGASGGTVTVVAMAAATRLVEKERQGRAIGIILMGLSSSLVLGVPIGTFLGGMFGWRILFVGIGVCSILPLLILQKRIPSIRETEGVPLRMQLSILKNPGILTALFITLLYVGGYSTLFTYITPFLQASSDLTITQISGILFLAGMCSFIGSKIGGQLADAKGPKFTITLGLLLQGAALLLFALPGGQVYLLVLVLLIFMLATWSISPAQQLLLVTLVPRNPDIALSVNTSFIQFGFALGSGVGGFAIRHTSILHLNWIGLAAVGLAGMLAFMLFKRKTQARGCSLVE